MKKVLLSIISITAFCFGVRSQNVYIPDANFKDYLLKSLINKNNDEEIQFSEAAEFAGIIDVSNKKISDLTGIEEFTKLTVLKCHDNPLTTLDVSKNTALTVLWCNDNLLTTLDVSKNKKLTQLYCYFNQLTTLDVSNNEKLTQLLCFGNQLTTLDVSNKNNKKLVGFDATGNPNLTCIQVDDVDYSKDSWNNNNIDSEASFSTDCPVYIPDANFKKYLVNEALINLNNDEEIQFF